MYLLATICAFAIHAVSFGEFPAFRSNFLDTAVWGSMFKAMLPIQLIESVENCSLSIAPADLNLRTATLKLLLKRVE